MSSCLSWVSVAPTSLLVRKLRHPVTWHSVSEGGCGLRVAINVLGTSPPPLPQSSESVTLDLLTYTDLESLRSRKLGGRPGAVAPRSAQLNSKRYLILIYSVEFDRWARGLARPRLAARVGGAPDFTLPAESVGFVSFYCCDWLQETEWSGLSPYFIQLNMLCMW